MKRIILFTFLLFSIKVSGQNDTITKSVYYSFIIQDSPSQLFTMRQFNQNYLSAYRLFAKGVNKTSKKRKFATIIQVGLGIFFIPLTHEEGHRSILTVNGIGSISQPYFNKHGAAYVKGVTDETLQNLRDTDLPAYIRLHTAGVESDYMLTKRLESISSFEQDYFDNYKWEYFLRKFSILQYYLTGLVEYEMELDEEANELDRDIVGHDIYGAARHLHRPEMEFYRYTKFSDLTDEEKDFVKRAGYRAFLNLLNPLIIKKHNFKLNEELKFNIGMGYTLAPFGDFIDENIWVKYKKLNISSYARQFQNKENWFTGFGLAISDYQISSRIFTSIAGHYWNQPIDLDFTTNQSFDGGAVDFDLKYFFLSKTETKLKGFSIDLGMIYKSKGFLPEEVYLKEHFGLRIGTTIKL